MICTNRMQSGRTLRLKASRRLKAKKKSSWQYIYGHDVLMVAFGKQQQVHPWTHASESESELQNFVL